MNTVIIVNPGAGGIESLREFEERLGPLAGAEILVTDRPGEGRSLSRYAAESGAELIVAAGGDGTIQEVMNGIVDSGEDVRLGVLPAGTGNDYARSLGIPLDLEQAARLIAETGEVRPLDLVKVDDPEGRMFANLAVGGFGARKWDSDVPEEDEEESKSRWGKLAYALEAADELTDLRSYRVMTRVDDRTAEDLEVISVIIANGNTTGGGIEIAPGSRPDDGQLVIVAIPALDLPDLASLAPAILAGNHLEDDRVVVRRGQRVTIESDPPMPFRADGEELGKGRMVFTLRPGAISVVMNPTESRS